MEDYVEEEDGIRAGHIFTLLQKMAEYFPGLRVGQILYMITKGEDSHQWEISGWNKRIKEVYAKQQELSECLDCGDEITLSFSVGNILCVDCWKARLNNKYTEEELNIHRNLETMCYIEWLESKVLELI